MKTVRRRFACATACMAALFSLAAMRLLLSAPAVSQSTGPAIGPLVVPGSSAPVWSLPLSGGSGGSGYRIINPRRKGGYLPDTLDAIGEWPMFRFQYRNRGSYEALVGSFTADMNAAAGTDKAGIHWFELRKIGTNGSWSIGNEGNYSPDSSHRWMGSAATDRGGNIAVAYNVSSSSMHPAIRYATRLVTDPAGQLGAEVTLHAGSAPQTGTNRWGDYSALTVDPSDDCTFWYTGEYLSSSAAGWRTRIGKFKIPQCGILYFPIIRKS